MTNETNTADGSVGVFQFTIENNNHSDSSIKSDRGQHSQFLRCLSKGRLQLCGRFDTFESNLRLFFTSYMLKLGPPRKIPQQSSNSQNNLQSDSKIFALSCCNPESLSAAFSANLCFLLLIFFNFLNFCLNRQLSFKVSADFSGNLCFFSNNSLNKKIV